MARGTVRWFSGEKGFGLVETGDGGCFVVHFAEISGDGFRSLDPGEVVEFEAGEDGRGRRLASNVRPLGKKGEDGTPG